MGRKSKKQHYVPQCYLKAWCHSDSKQIYVFDKKQEVSRSNSIKDVASERYFYDVSPADVFADEFINELQERNPSWDPTEKNQGIENTLSSEVEEPFSDLLTQIREKGYNATPWIIKNCYFISEENKAEFSSYLAVQFIRTRRVRNGILDTADCVIQWLEDMGIDEETIKRYSITSEDARVLHAHMLLDANELTKLSECFRRLTWILVINKSSRKLYTTDNPIGTHGHIDHPFYSNNGIASEGVEVFFPISPELILVMVDGDYHKHWKPLERRYLEITDSQYIQYYNALLALQADQFVFSLDGDVTILDEMKENDKNVFKTHHAR